MSSRSSGLVGLSGNSEVLQPWATTLPPPHYSISNHLQTSSYSQSIFIISCCSCLSCDFLVQSSHSRFLMHRKLNSRIDFTCCLHRSTGFQRLPPARGGTAQRKIFHLANRSQLIHPGPSSSRSRFFMESS